MKDGEPGQWSVPEGPYTYHYEEKDWDMFDCRELETAPHWDGHTEKDVLMLMSLWRLLTHRLRIAILRRESLVL